MKLNQLLHADQHRVFIDILSECAEFISSTGALPLRRTLPCSYEDIQRVKVRKRKKRSDFNTSFNEAFVDEVRELRQRAIFANGIVEQTDTEDVFYIFPPDGFSFIYSTEVTNSTEQYRAVFEEILTALDKHAEITFQDLLKFSYTSSDLKEGIESGAEIIIYNTPFYYVVRESLYPDYEELLSLTGEQ